MISRKGIYSYGVISFGVLALLVGSVSLPGCKNGHQNQEILDKMRDYDRFLVKMAVDSLSNLYGPEGALGEVAKGPDSIRKFLARFSNYRVLFNESTTDSIRMIGDTAYQVGKYHQTTILPNKDTIRVSGKFFASWDFLENGGWRIRKMSTSPDKE